MRFIAIPVLVAAIFAADPNYSRDVDQYRAHREAELKQDDGWLTVVGLFRLQDGDNQIALPPLAHPVKIAFSKGHATYFADGKPGVALKPNEQKALASKRDRIKDLLEESGELHFGPRERGLLKDSLELLLLALTK